MDEANVLLGTAAGVGFVHTLLGLDHSLPFVALGRAQGWSLRRTLAVTAGCGFAHVVSSVLIGAVGIGAGVALERLEVIESTRGGFVAWLLIGFGLAYTTWALVKAWRGKGHQHTHVQADDTVHDHDYGGVQRHDHRAARAVTFWSLFLIFAFGPCEALIPLLMAPAWAQSWGLMVGVTALFGLVTMGTMLGAVGVLWTGLEFAPVRRLGLDRWAEPMAGAVVAGSGALILVGF